MSWSLYWKWSNDNIIFNTIPILHQYHIYLHSLSYSLFMQYIIITYSRYIFHQIVYFCSRPTYCYHHYYTDKYFIISSSTHKYHHYYIDIYLIKYILAVKTFDHYYIDTLFIKYHNYSSSTLSRYHCTNHIKYYTVMILLHKYMVHQISYCHCIIIAQIHGSSNIILSWYN